MRPPRIRSLAVATVVALVALGSGSTFAATTTFPGSITITNPTANGAYRGTIEIDWTWRTGSAVKSTSTVDLTYTTDGVFWSAIQLGVPIRRGTVAWNTTLRPDARYAVRATVRGTTVRSTVSPISIDNTAPAVEIVRPAPTEIIVDDATLLSVRYIAGTSTVAAESFDAFTGIAAVVWSLDGEEIGRGATLRYAFGARPGTRALSALAVDRAGNIAEHTVEVVVLPGPSNLPGTPETSPAPAPSTSPSPDAGAPPAPDAGTVPGSPSAPPSPEPALPALPLP